jgi:hypothetical protein
MSVSKIQQQDSFAKEAPGTQHRGQQFDDRHRGGERLQGSNQRDQQYGIDERRNLR